MAEFRTVVPDFAGADAESDVIGEALEAIRTHLGMEVAYLSEFVDGKSVFRRVDAPGLEALIKEGDAKDLEDVYCKHILDGRLPELIPDTSAEPIAAAMPITAQVPIGAHMSIPIRLSDGSAYGMFCCLSPTPNPSLNARDLETMRIFASLAARQVEAGVLERRDAERRSESTRRALEARAFHPVYQPIVDLASREAAGYEALCRFTPEPYRSPDLWFADAHAAGLGAELELAVLATALEGAEAALAGVYVSLNASPDTVIDPRFADLLGGANLRRLVLEITEHAPVSDYDRLLGVLADLRAAGLRLAVDDAGAGHSSLQHIVRLRPDMVKIDMSLTRGVDVDQSRRALIGALSFYSFETDAEMVAEGIETEAEFETLRLLGVSKGQGYYLGRPGALPSAVATRAAG